MRLPVHFSVVGKFTYFTTRAQIFKEQLLLMQLKLLSPANVSVETTQ